MEYLTHRQLDAAFDDVNEPDSSNPMARALSQSRKVLRTVEAPPAAPELAQFLSGAALAGPGMQADEMLSTFSTHTPKAISPALHGSSLGTQGQSLASDRPFVPAPSGSERPRTRRRPQASPATKRRLLAGAAVLITCAVLVQSATGALNRQDPDTSLVTIAAETEGSAAALSEGFRVQVGAAGSVVLVADGGELVIQAVSFAPGWAATVNSTGTGVGFRSATAPTVQFEAELSGTTVVVSIGETNIEPVRLYFDTDGRPQPAPADVIVLSTPEPEIAPTAAETTVVPPATATVSVPAAGSSDVSDTAPTDPGPAGEDTVDLQGAQTPPASNPTAEPAPEPTPIPFATAEPSLSSDDDHDDDDDDDDHDDDRDDSDDADDDDRDEKDEDGANEEEEEEEDENDNNENNGNGNGNGNNNDNRGGTNRGEDNDDDD